MTHRVRVVSILCPNCGPWEPVKPGLATTGDLIDPESVDPAFLHDAKAWCGRCEGAGRGKVPVLLSVEPV